MPDTATAKTGGGGSWITRKIGPLPAWGWGLAAVGVYYWYTHYGPGASKAAAAQQPAAGGGLKTYAPHITENITQAGPGGGRRKPKPKTGPGRKPKAPAAQPPRAGTVAPAGAAGVRPGGGVNPGGPKKPGPRKRPPPPVPQPQPSPPTGGPDQSVSANYTDAGYQPGGPVNADTGQPVYWEWQHAHRGPEVPMPVQAYAPMTSGSVYDVASTGAAVAAG